MKKYVLGPNAARKLTELMRGKGEVSSRPGIGAGLAFDAEYAHPFAVQWAASVGSWIIWLPSEDLVTVYGIVRDPTEMLEDAGGDYPDGWYALPDGVLSGEKGGKLILFIDANGEVEFKAGKSSDDDETDPATGAIVDGTERVVPIAIAKVANDGTRTVKQLTTSAIIIDSGTGTGDGDTRYGADEMSVSLVQSVGGGDSVRHGNIFHLKGFGKFSVQGHADPYGTFQPSSILEISEDDPEDGLSFMVRTGDKDEKDGNSLGFRKIKIGAGVATPFKYTVKKEPIKEGEFGFEEGAVVLTTKIANNVFYFNGELVELSDYTPGLDGTVYLTSKRSAAGSSDGGKWTHQLAMSPVEAPEGGKARNIKLYDIRGGKVVMDYRTTFLTVDEATGGVKSLTGDAQGSKAIEGEVEIDGSACGLVVKTGTVTQGEKKTAKLTIDAIGRSADDNAWGAKTMKLPDGSYIHFLGCGDVDLSNITVPTDPPSDPDNPPSDPDDIDVDAIKRVITLTGDAQGSTPVSGNVAAGGATGSGLHVVTNGPAATDQNQNPGGTMNIELEGRAQGDVFAVRTMTVQEVGKQDKPVKIFGTEDVVIPIGKTIKTVDVKPSAAPGGTNEMVFHYTDGSSDTFSVMNGLNGRDATGGGGGGDAPDIRAVSNSNQTEIFIDGDLVATIPHGKKPTITASKNGKITTIFCDGVAIAEICDGNDGKDGNDGDDGESSQPGTPGTGETGQECTFVSDISFAIQNGKLVANVKKMRGRVVGLTDLGTTTVDVATSKEVTVVTGETYSTANHQLTNTRTKITVLATAAATGQTVFTATPLSNE